MKRHGLILLVVLGAAPAAGAQPAVEVRTSFGATNYRQNDLEFAAPAVRVAVRAGGRRFAVEPELAFAWRSTDRHFSPVPESRRECDRPGQRTCVAVFWRRNRRVFRAPAIDGERSGGHADIRATRRHADRVRRGFPVHATRRCVRPGPLRSALLRRCWGPQRVSGVCRRRHLSTQPRRPVQSAPAAPTCSPLGFSLAALTRIFGPSPPPGSGSSEWCRLPLPARRSSSGAPRQQ